MFVRRSALVVLGLLVAALVPLGASPVAAAGTVSVTVFGQGSVTGTGISCSNTGGDCSEFYADTTYQDCDPAFKPPCHTVTESPVESFTAGPDTNGYLFVGWTGACAGVQSRTCTLAIDSDASVGASFADVQPPTLSSLTPASGFHRGTIALGVTATDNHAVNKVDFLVRGATVATDASAPYQALFDTTSLSDGVATIEARGYDTANNMSMATTNITIDNTAPTLDVTGPDTQVFGPGSTQTWSFTAGDATSGVSSLQCSVALTGEPADFGACTSPTSESVSNQPDGAYTFDVRATDAAGNVRDATRTFTIDATPPQTSIEKGPGKVVKTRRSSVKVPFAFASTEQGSTYSCRLDRGAWKPCAASQSFKVGLGRHTLRVAAIDALGNLDQSPASRTWTVKRAG